MFLSGQTIAAESADVDFSCMKQQVRPIIMVTDRHQEFDVVVRNWCPGDVYWAMCIERLDPWTFKVIETHTPSGHVQVEKRSRVNLQMKAMPNTDGDQNRLQAFYVNVAYAIDGPPEVSCVAGKCEAGKKELRAEVAKADKAWLKAKRALEARAEAECPDNAWNNSDTETCRQAVIEAAAEEMAIYEQTDKDLQDRLLAAGPGNCTMHGGQVLELTRP
jgi:hypothetical protein